MESFGIGTIADAQKAIKQAWLAAIVSGGLTLIVAILAIAGGGQLLGGTADGWAVIDALLIFGLAYGIYRKSRVAAVVLLSYFILSQLMMRIDGLGASGVGLAVVFFFLYVRGVAGTIAYHKLVLSETAMQAT